MRISVSTIITSLFAAFVLHSVYNLYLLYRPPSCNEKDVCYKSFLNSQPKLELLVYLSDSYKSNGYQNVLHIPDFDYNEAFQRDINFIVPKAAHSNQSIYIHTLIIPKRQISSEITFKEAESLHDSTHVKSKLTKHAVPVSATFNLLQNEKIHIKSPKAVTHLKTRYAVVLCNDVVGIPHSGVPLELLKYLRINPKKQFLPIVSQDILQSRLKDLEEVTKEKKQMMFTFIYQPISIGKFKFLVQMETTFVNFMEMGFTTKDVDEVKGVFADTNFYLLCATMTIGSIHLLFDFLSFKNDVSFWRSHKSMAGLSSRTVLWRCFSQTVVFFFLLDEGTSLLVLIPNGIAMIIEFWKITKVYKLRFGLSGIKVDKTYKETVAEQTTKKYDDESMKYLNYLLFPLLVCAAIYSLIYQPHKSWYSWTINSLVNAVYAFGFIFMLPQLFINYRLKSVAALPWRAFTYRAFNTFIDDIFAFIITMPTAHRIACFRDDVVFLVYLYQRWLYPVDKTRSDDGTEMSAEVVQEPQETKKDK
ncbi:lipid scramblase CLPTM1L [Atheta coriaria]|uniref:lipid scramblase CLPTM1L n=1 Tax=Dalotia coriaria TaxID=877792 RepID=UPI0031F33CD5